MGNMARRTDKETAIRNESGKKRKTHRDILSRKDQNNTHVR